MAKRARAPETSEDLLAALASTPSRAIALFASALTGPGKAGIEQALQEDPRVRAAYRAALGDLDALDETPWVVQFAGTLGLHDASPELLRIARADQGSASEQAALGLLRLGDRGALAALAEGVETARFVQSRSVEALFVLGDASAFERLGPLVASGSRAGVRALWHLVAHPDAVAREPRWLDAAVDALSRPATSEAARNLLVATLPAAQRRARLGHLPPAVVPMNVSEEALFHARAAVAKALAKMESVPRPDAGVHERLAELRTLVGRIPPIVQALHERVDGIRVVGERPANRVILYDTAAILEDARAWDKEQLPRESPRALVHAFLWPVAPDGFTKAGFSGGPPFGFELPGDADDPVLTNTPKKPTYLAFVTRELRRAVKIAPR